MTPKPKLKILALIALVSTIPACNFGSFSSQTSNTCNSAISFLRSAVSGEQGAHQNCADPSRYVFQAQRFSPELPDGEPYSEGTEISMEFEGERLAASVFTTHFSTRSIAQVDTDARQHPEAYDRVEYQVGFKGANGKALFSKSSEDSIADAFSQAVTECRLRTQEKSQ